jgi:(p)ppGpp synthase/HD superfamily hydrolase
MNIEPKELAFEIAKNAFKNKTDKGGKPYFEHLVRVAKRFKDDDFLYPIAILHDLIEDCPEWNETSLRCLFSENIVSTIVVLTKKDNEDYFEYIDRINQSSWAARVKISDLKDNMDITRLKTITEKDFERLSKYLKAYRILTSEND